jgi:hypothetical protein
MTGEPTQVVVRVDPGSDAEDTERSELAFRLRDDLDSCAPRPGSEWPT